MSARKKHPTPTVSTTHEETARMSAKRTMRRITAALLGTAAAALALGAHAAPALAEPVLGVSMELEPSTGISADGRAKYAVSVSNSGSEETTSPVTVDFEAPIGLKIEKVKDPVGEIIEGLVGIPTPMWECAIAGDRQSASCEGPDPTGIVSAIFELPFPAFPIFPGEDACEFIGLPCPFEVFLEADSSLTHDGTIEPTVEASGGGAPAPASTSDVAPTWLAFDLIDFEAGSDDDENNPYTQAGGRPYENVTDFEFSASIDQLDFPVPSGDVKDIKVEVPPGLVANVNSYPQCTEAQLATKTCPSDSQIGTAEVFAADYSVAKVALSNMVPPAGQPAQFGFNVSNAAWIHIHPVVRPDGTFSIDTDNITQLASVLGSTVTFWGVPADPVHDSEREGPGCEGIGGCASTAPLKPYLTMPTSCTGPQTTTIRANSWQDPGNLVEASSVSPGNDGCNALDFSPTIQARPTTNVADAPSGLDVDVHTPQNEICDPGPPLSCGTAEAHLKDTVLTLPEGFVINPSGTNGLAVCTPAQVGIDPDTGTPDASQPSCPNSSRIGSVEVETPLVDHTLPGSVFLATPYDNPFDSLIAIYIVVNDPQTGILQKLDGEVTLDPQSGRLTTTVKDAPQLPFEHFRVHIFGGAQGALRTPAACGDYTTTSTLTPWSEPDSGPPATPSDTYAVSQGPGGGACSTSAETLPNSPSLDAGTVSPVAGAFSPMVVNLRRPDGSQQFSTVSLTLPPGLTGRLAGIEYCSEAALAAAAAKSGAAEQASASCPAASRIGGVSVAAGAGPAPYWVQGTAYLTGPYKGAPLGMAIVTPANAGPFDLGTVVVRAALHVDPETTQIAAVSDPIPSILEGIPLNITQALIRADRPQFTRTGTNCNPFAFSGQLVSTLGQPAALSSRYQLGECSSLGFKPKLALRIFGKRNRGANPRFRAVLRMPEGGANIARAQVTLPSSEILDQAHIRTVCTRVQYAARACPAASVYGHARAWSPLLDQPLQGPVYLRSSSNKLPDLVASLDGQVHVDLVGRVDSVNGGIRNTFEAVPDVPVSVFVLNMLGGGKGLLQNSTNVCRGKHRATVLFDGQNGRAHDFKPVLRAQCGKQRRRQRKDRRHSRRPSLRILPAAR